MVWEHFPLVRVRRSSEPRGAGVSARLFICPCASSSSASLLQGEACLPVTLESPLHHLARPGLHSTILASEQCRKTLAIKAHVCGAIGAPAWTPASTQSPIRAVATRSRRSAISDFATKSWRIVLSAADQLCLHVRQLYSTRTWRKVRNGEIGRPPKAGSTSSVP